MVDPARILILGGTAEALALARRAAADSRLAVTYSLAGATGRPETPDCAVRVGGFGGVSGLRAYLRRSGTRLLVDATHPFAAQMSRQAAEACAEEGVPRVALQRPPWQRRTGDRWTEVEDIAGAADAVARLGTRVFLTLGGRGLEPFARLAGIWFLVRLIEPPDAPLPLADCEAVAARGPFDVAGEVRLMAGNRIDCLVSRNSGGAATYAKIAAARALGLPAVMVRRPPLPTGDTVDTVEAALARIDAALG